MSGIIARSWNTVAMPLFKASRGEASLTSSPSMSSLPSSCWCTPESVFIRVDFPAPLSPSRHKTSPVPTCMEMSWSAITLPKYFEMPWTSTSRVEVAVSAAVISTSLLCCG